MEKKNIYKKRLLNDFEKPLFLCHKIPENLLLLIKGAV